MAGALLKASISAAVVSQGQRQAISPALRGLDIRAIFAERTAVAPEVTPSGKSGQTGASLSAPERLTSSQKSGTRGQLKQLWNFSNVDEPYRIAEEPTQENYGGFINYETIDGSFGDRSQDQLICETPLHTPETFSKFLRLVPATALRDVAQACYLSNLAYAIPEIKADEFQQRDHLRLITSSVARAAAMEGSPTKNKDGKGGELVISPATACALAATASYLQSQRNTSPRTGEISMSSELLSRSVDHQLSSAVSSFIGAEETSPIAPAELAGSSQEERCPSPCEWFVCDELETSTRIFSIQGSESMASWKANLQFQPTHFEDSSSGVMVHQGIYEVAKLLYNQFLPLVRSYLKEHGMNAKISFTGHSLGGSLAVLLSLMFRYRENVPVFALKQVFTFGAPSVMNGGDRLLKRLGFPPSHIQSVVISRDLVPRIFSCDVPDQIAKVLKRVNQNFRNLPSFVNQGQLYSPSGQMLILQPEAQQAPGHPLLPSGSGLYILELPKSDGHISSKTQEVWEAERSFMNTPHPLEIMSDASSYGSDGAISRDHDPRSYRKAVNHVLKQALQGLQRRKIVNQLEVKRREEIKSQQVWPPSPVDTSVRSKRMAHAGLFLQRKSFRVAGAATSGVSSHVNERVSVSMAMVDVKPRICSRRGTHVLGSHSHK